MQDHDIHVMRECVTNYLKHVGRIESDIKQLETRIEDLRESMRGLAINLGTSRGCSVSDRMADGVAKIIEYEREWNDRIVNDYDEFNAVRDMCDVHHVGRYAMWMRVVEGRTWEYIGSKIGYCERHARTIADGGVRELYPLIPEEYRRSTFPNAAPL